MQLQLLLLHQQQQQQQPQLLLLATTTATMCKIVRLAAVVRLQFFAFIFRLANIFDEDAARCEV